MALIRTNTDEIRGDRALQWCGALVAVTGVLGAVAWRTAQPLEEILARGEPAVCWPFFPGCAAAHVVDAAGVVAIALGFGVLAAAAAALFVAGRVRAAWWTLLALTIGKVVVIALDFRLRLNQHTMAVLFAVVFLFCPRKRDALRVLVVLFFVAAGALKLNHEWLSGSDLYDVDKLWLPTALVPAACAFVVLLELVLVWGLFARRAVVHYTVLALVVAFHLFSWPLVGFLYPLVMLCLVAIFPLCRVFPRDDDAPWPRMPKAPVWITAALFGLLQLAPVVIPGDAAITGEGRAFALHMFDARVECRSRFIAHAVDGSEARVALPRGLSWRIHCDPIVFWNAARAACRADPPPARVELILESRHSDDAAFHRVIELPNFCADDPDYAMLHHNAWIRVP